MNSPDGVVSEVGREVLAFYREMPFNWSGNIEHLRKEVLSLRPSLLWPLALKWLWPGARVLEVGCGTGILSNAMALHCGAMVTAIDFNPLAIETAQQISARLGLQSRTDFAVADIFEFDFRPEYDLIVSNGVLHHTGDCLGALSKLLATAAAGTKIVVGLYHIRGRAPFLGHFNAMREAGAVDRDLLRTFSSLFAASALDEAHLLSWFRDQVLHPHETQHCLTEIVSTFEEHGFDFVDTSIGGWAGRGLEFALSAELQLEKQAQARLREGKYFPGFFLVAASRKL